MTNKSHYMEKDNLSYKLLEKRQKIYNKLEKGEYVDKKSFAYWMRLNPTNAEKEMRKILQEIGERFHRQVIIDPYIVDFMYKRLNFIIEIDGPYHNLTYDKKRDAFLKNKKMYIMRFSLEDLYYRREKTKEKIINGLNFLKYKRETKTLF